MDDSHRTALRREARQFAAAHCNADLEALDRSETFNRAGWRACAQFGLLAQRIPAELGGRPRPLAEQLELWQGVGEGCEDNGLLLALGAQVWACTTALLAAEPAVQQAVLPRLARGEALVSHAVSEPKHGSDVAAMQTRARRDGDGYVIDGVKTWVTNAPLADYHVVFASTDPGAGSRGLSAFLVEAEGPGVVTRSITKMGLCTAQMGLIELDEVRVPLDHRIGAEGQGFTILQHCLAWERAFVLSPALGTMTRLMQRCVAHARRRRQFDRAIGEFDGVAGPIVDMRLRIDAGRALLREVGEFAADGRSFHEQAALLKLHLSEAWVQTCADALQIHGAQGYTRESSFEREYRDAIGSRIFSGTSAIQRRIVAQFMGVRG